MNRARPHRSELSVPGSNRQMIEKARQLDADVVMLDLEDAVAPDDKIEARANVMAALRSSKSWRARALSVRVNALDTRWCYRDIVDVAEQAGDVLSLITIPKVRSAADVHFVATLLDQVELALGPRATIGLSVLIETAEGMAHVHEIAAACPDRLEAMVFGVADYAASLQSATTSIGGSDPGYAVLAGDHATGERELHCGDQWHYALSQVAVACRAQGLRPIDGPFGAIDDPEAYAASARRAAVLGYEGKWAIHPSQIALAHKAFTPDERTIQRTRRIVAAMEAAAADGRGAVTLDGALIDAASTRMAQNLLRKVEEIEAAS